MHRTIEIAVPPSHTDELLDRLGGLRGVISLSVVRGASVKPEGDVVAVHALNREADEVLRLAKAAGALAGAHGRVSVSTGELTSMVDPEHERQVAEDVDEALWEEVETNLRLQSRATANYLILMALGGAIAATGLVVRQPTEQALSFVSGAIVAPGPLRGAAQGVGGPGPRATGRGGEGPRVGGLGLPGPGPLCGALLLGAAPSGGGDGRRVRGGNPGVHSVAHLAPRGVLLSACGALGGMLMLTTHRQYLLPGTLIALRAIESAALVGAALIASEPGLALGALERFVVAALLVFVAGVVVVGLKQALVHRRTPMV